MRNLLSIFILVALFQTSAVADYYSVDEADYSLVDDVVEVIVKEDGSSKTTQTTTYKVNNDKGRQALALKAIPYLPETTKIKLNWAKTINGQDVTSIDLKTVQNRELQGPTGGLSKARQLIIPFTHLQADSSVSFQYVEETKNKLIPGSFGMKFIYGLQFPELAGETKIISKKPLYFNVSDPNGSLKITEGREGKDYTLTVKLLKKAFYVPKDEAAMILEPSQFPRAEVSTMKTWNEVSNVISKKYEKALASPLPPGFKKIAEKAKSGSTEIEKAQIVISELATIMTYSGDWTSLERMMFPRGHKEVEKSHTGDCKDFATSTVGILRSLNIKAHVAMVTRKSPQEPDYLLEREPVNPANPLPSVGYFNHAIVKMETTDGKIIWLDPTNPVSQHKAPFSDIAGSYALSLEDKNSKLEKIPFERDPESQSIVEKNFTPRLDGSAEFSGSVKATGQSAAATRAMALQRGKATLDQMLWTVLLVKPKKERMSISAYDFKSRMYKPFEVNMQATVDSPVTEKEKDDTNLLSILPINLLIFKVASLNRLSSLYIGDLGEDKVISTYKNVDIEDEVKGDCLVFSEWMDIKRRLYKVPEGLRVEDSVVTKKSFIRSADFKSPAFENFMGKLSECGGSQLLKVSWLDMKNPEQLDNRKILENTASIEKGIELSTQGSSQSYTDAFKAVRIFEAILRKEPNNIQAQAWIARPIRDMGYLSGTKYNPEYLKKSMEESEKAIALDPSSGRAHMEKSRSLMYLKKLDDASKEFSLAYKYEPKLSSIYILGGDLMKESKKYSLAEKSYAKALTLAQNSNEKQSSLKRLASLSLDQAHHEKAIEYYTQCLQITPEDAWAMNNMAISYNSLSRWDEAIAILNKAQKNGSFGAARANLSDAYAGKAGSIVKNPNATLADLKKAEELAMNAVKLSSESPEALGTLAVIYLEMSKKDGLSSSAERSIEYYQKTFRTGPPPIWVMQKFNGQRIPASAIPQASK